MSTMFFASFLGGAVGVIAGIVVLWASTLRQDLKDDEDRRAALNYAQIESYERAKVRKPDDILTKTYGEGLARWMRIRDPEVEALMDSMFKDSARRSGRRKI